MTRSFKHAGSVSSLRNRFNSRVAFAIAAGTAGLFVSSSAYAIVGDWLGPTNNPWSDPARWSGGVPNGQGDTAQYSTSTAASQITIQDIANPGGVTVGTLRVYGGNNNSWQITPNGGNVYLNQDGTGPLPAVIRNDIQSATPGGNSSIFANFGTSGAFVLQDDTLFVTNTSNSIRANGSVRMVGALVGTLPSHTINVENVTNTLLQGSIQFGLNQSSAFGGFAGNVNIRKGAVSIVRGDTFTPSPGNTVTIGAAGMGDVTFGVTAGALGNMENGFVIAADTGGTTVFASHPQGGSIGNVQIKTTNTNAASIRLDGNVVFDNRSAGTASTFTIGDVVHGIGRITAKGADANALVRLTNTNSYQGGTVVDTGTLVVAHAPDFNNGFGFHAATNGTLGSGDVTVNSTAVKLEVDGLLSATNVIADTAAVTLGASGGIGKLQLNGSVNETIGGLVINGVAKTVNGTYGSSSSGATFVDDTAFSGTGMVTLALGRTLYWDTNGSTDGAGGATPTGTWGGDKVVFNTNSSGGAGGTLSYNTIATDPVVFTAGTDGTGAYTVTVNGTQNAASLSVARGDVTMTGSGTVNTPTVDVASGATATITSGLTGPTNAITKTGTGTLAVSKLPSNNSMSITAGTVRVLDSSPTLPDHPSGDNAFVSRPTALSISPGATLDLGNNDLIIDYAGGTSPVADIEALVASGFNGGEWNGDGIISTTALADPNFVLAVAENALLLQPFGDGVGDDPLFAGQVVDDTTVLVKFTHRVDLDLDGLITGNDAAVFNAFFNEGQPATWQFGDLDYDGVYSGNDAAIFNGFYNESLASVPEPAALGLLAVAGAALAARRRRR